MNVDTHLNIAGIPDVLLVCSHRPSVLSRPADGRTDGWMGGWVVGRMTDGFSLREKRARRGSAGSA